jgi:hypothetical protein
MASLLGSGGEGEEREAVRVLDPEIAEAYFVPFFSSLSFNTHGRNMTDPETEKDRQLQVILDSFFSSSFELSVFNLENFDFSWGLNFDGF